MPTLKLNKKPVEYPVLQEHPASKKMRRIHEEGQELELLLKDLDSRDRQAFGVMYAAARRGTLNDLVKLVRNLSDKDKERS
jgi:hypothetical protein